MTRIGKKVITPIEITRQNHADQQITFLNVEKISPKYIVP